MKLYIGSADQVLISTSALSRDWIATKYNNGKHPSPRTKPLCWRSLRYRNYNPVALSRFARVLAIPATAVVPGVD